MELPLLTAAVGTATSPGVRNTPADVRVVEYSLSQLAQIKFVTSACGDIPKPGPNVQQAADAVQCWDTDLGQAIKAFQTKLGFTPADGIIQPDSRVWKRLFEYGEYAEKLLEDRRLRKDRDGYVYYGFFDAVTFQREFTKKYPGQLNSGEEVMERLLALLKYMAADPSIVDIRWMAYMLTTVADEVGWGNWACHDEEKELYTRYAKGDGYGNPVKIRPWTKQDIEKDDPATNGVEGDYLVILKSGTRYRVRASNGTDEKLKKPADSYKDAEGTEHIYFGRGYPQLTWWENYAKAGIPFGLGLQLLINPEKANEPELSYKIMSHCMRTGYCFANERKLGDYIFGVTADYLGARKIVNARDSYANAQKMADRALVLQGILLTARATPPKQ